MTLKRILIGLVVIVVLAGAAALAYAMRYPALPAITPPEAASFDSAQVEKGHMLASIGDCGVCHTRPGGEPYAGGLPLPSPFGTIYTTNITPDPQTGIGQWSLEAFTRAMHEGVDRNGGYLYPAFPYDHFAKVTEEDIAAIYAYLMAGVQPVAYQAPENEMPFPFNIRLGVAGWNLLFLKQGVWQDDPTKDAEWNRGAYLAEGLGHCGACHSPRNFIGAVDMGAGAFSGGEAEGWHAPALDGSSPAPIKWTQNALVDYLFDGWHEDHGIAGGPMTPIVDDLYDQSEDDIFAIAAYIASLQEGAVQDEAAIAAARAQAESLEWGASDAPAVPTDPTLAEGARVFEARCVTCHKAGGNPAPLALTAALNSPHAGNAIITIQNGIKPPRGSLDRTMPAQGLNLTDAEFVAVVKFIRDRFSDEPAWANIEAQVQAVRQGH
jgi:mono/diheme cytochrome c family protein